MKKILLLLLLLLPLLGFGQDKEVIITLKTDSYPSENRWVLYDSIYQGAIISEVQ